MPHQSPLSTSSNQPSVLEQTVVQDDTHRAQQPWRIDAGWLVTMNADDAVLKDSSLIIRDGQIIDCLSWHQADRRYPGIDQRDHRSSILMPGLINAHTHLAMSLLRGFADDLPLHDWLQNYIWPAESRHVNEDFIRDGTELALAESLLSGVTTFNDMYFHANITADVCHIAGVRAMLGLLVLDFPTPGVSSTDQYFDQGLALHDQVREHPLLCTAFAPHAPYTVSVALQERIAMLSAELGNRVHMHVHETQKEVDDHIRQHGIRPLQRLAETGLLNNELIAVHLTQLLPEEISLLAKCGVKAVHCPESNLKLASGISPVASMLNAGVTVAVGTDGAASNNDLDLLGELRTAALIAKNSAEDATAVPAMQALRMITSEAARTLGFSAVGSLEIGKEADCITIEPGLSQLPVYDVVAQLVYTQCSHCVTDVWVRGRQLVKDRQLQTLDATAIIEKSRRWAERMRA